MEIPVRDTPVETLLALGVANTVDREALMDCVTFLRVAKKSLQYFYLKFREADLTPAKYSVLSELLAADQQTLAPSELADRIGITRPSVTSLVDALEKQQLVKRQSSSEDRRRMTVAMTARGKTVMSDLLPEIYGRMAALTGFENRAMSKQFRRALSLMEAELEEQLSEEVPHAEN